MGNVRGSNVPNREKKTAKKQGLQWTWTFNSEFGNLIFFF